MRKNIVVAAVGTTFVLIFALRLPAAEIKLARHPDYHDGKIVFSYAGDLWLVNEDGSQPTRLTVHRARATHPHFSPDGKWIAFSSGRYGGTDVFAIPTQGGPAKRLTFRGAGDTVVGWSRDSKGVLFSSARGRVFPGIPSLYAVSVEGGLEEPLPTDWGYWASYSPDGKKLAFNRHPIPWSRKHYRGSYAADLWVMDVESKTFRKVLDENLTDDMKPNNLWPMYANGFIYFVSDRDVMAKAGSGQVMTSTNNIWKVSEEGGKPVQVTRHSSGSLFWPSLSSDNKTIVYEENLGLWKLDLASGESKEIKISINTDEKENNLETLVVDSEADSYHLSPSGKRAVIATHGELFTIATDKGDVRRLTRTAGVREGQPRWSPDGKWIAFVGDQNGQDEVWLCDEQGGGLKQVSNSDSPKGQISWAPDSKALLYTGADRKLYVYHLDTDRSTVVASGEVVGFGGSALMNPQWSPDGQWIAYHKSDPTLLSHVYVVAATGGKEQRITDDDVYSDSNALWTPDGKQIVYLAGGDVGNIGQAGRSTAQIYIVSLLPEEKDPTSKGIDNEEDASKEDRRGRPRRIPPGGQDRNPAATDPDSRDGDDSAPPRPRPGADKKVEVKIDFRRIGRRARQLTRTADNIGSMAISPDSSTLAFVTSGTEGGRSVQSIWTMQLDGERLTRVTQSSAGGDEEGPPIRRMFGGGFASLQFAKDGRSLFYRQRNGVYSIGLSFVSRGGDSARDGDQAPDSRRGPIAMLTASGRSQGATGKRVNFTARVEIDHRAERRQVFKESWRIMKHRFYAADMHGVDWAKAKARYEPLLDFVSDQEDLHEVISMMIGELNASHTGISGGGDRGGRREARAAGLRYPGFELQADSSGFYRVAHIYKHGPADKDYVKIETGNFILAINGQDLKAGDNYWKLYAEAPSSRWELTVNSKPAKEGAWKTKLTPISAIQYSNLQYENWVADRRATVDKLSNGTIGYLHIRQMNDSSLRQFERDLAALHLKKGLIIDQRFNPGGGIDQELLQILQQKQYQYTRVRDSVQVTRPLRGFFGPMVVMANERSTSDAEVFPDGFRTLKLGKVVGTTTYGAVIGTGAYQLMDGSSIRTPSSGLWNVNGQNLENFGVPPDVAVDNTPEDFLKGRDAQLEKAVEVITQEMKTKAAAAGG
jgi:tricorn protease